MTLIPSPYWMAEAAPSTPGALAAVAPDIMADAAAAAAENGVVAGAAFSVAAAAASDADGRAASAALAPLAAAAAAADSVGRQRQPVKVGSLPVCKILKLML